MPDEANSTSLVTRSREVGCVYVHQSRDGGSMLGVVINDVSYIGFKVINDFSINAPDYRLYCLEYDEILETDEWPTAFNEPAGTLQEKGLVWKVTSDLDSRHRRPGKDLPKTELYIRLATLSGSVVLTEYFVGKMKDAVSMHPSGSGMMSDRFPSFGVFKREFGDEDLVRESSDNLEGPFNKLPVAVVEGGITGAPDATSDGLNSAGADATQNRFKRALTNHLSEIAKSDTETSDSDESEQRIASVFSKSVTAINR